MSRWTRAARAAAVAPATVLGLALAGLVAPTEIGPTEALIGSPAAVPPVSTTPFDVPASQTRLVVRRGPGLAATPAAHRGTLDIPGPALAAYHRAAVVMEASDPACQLPWELLAAIGRVESDHGRYGGSALDESGHARPAIVGVRLDGRGPVAAIRDTDAGVLDGDARWDRAVGPMQFIPSTWSVVGVDADGDGQRDPQDIDDAALAAGVYLCAGDVNLATEVDREAAVHAYNHDDSYVALVLRIFESYVAAAANIAAMPAGTVVGDTVLAVRTRTLHTGSNSGPRDEAPPPAPEPATPPPDESTEPSPGPGTEPSEEPAVEEPPAEEPPAEEPPAEEPPAEEPPAEEPPAEEPTTCESTEATDSTEPTEPTEPVPPEGEDEVGCGSTTEPEPTPEPGGTTEPQPSTEPGSTP